MDALTAWMAVPAYRSRPRRAGPRTTPEGVPPVQFPDAALLPAVFVPPPVPLRPRARLVQPAASVLDDLWTGFVLWLAQDVQPQPRRRTPRPEALTALAPGLVIDDMGAMTTWAAPPGVPLPRPRLVRQSDTPLSMILPLGLDLTAWPVLDQSATVGRQRRPIRQTQHGEPPLAFTLDLPAWPLFDTGNSARQAVRRGHVATAAPTLPPDADAVLWLGWNAQAATPQRPPRRTRPDSTAASVWFDSLIVDILYPQKQDAVVRRPAPRVGRGATDLPVTVQSDSSWLVTAADAQPRPRPRPGKRPALSGTIDVAAWVGGGVAPKVGGPYIVVVGGFYQGGGVAGIAQAE